MTESGKEIGKLGRAVLDHLVESKMGEGYVGNPKEPATDERIAVAQAMQSTADRLWKYCSDKSDWTALFDRLPRKRKLLTKLGPAVKDFYRNPTDDGFTGVLTEILKENQDLSPEAVRKTVNRYIKVLTEELLLADKGFRENVRGLSDRRMAMKLRRAEELLESQKPTPVQASQGNDAPLQVDVAELPADPPMADSLEADETVIPPQAAEAENPEISARVVGTAEEAAPEPAGLPDGSRYPNIRPNPHFMGRSKELQQLEMLLKEKKPVVIGEDAAVTGTGGIGKTQLAREVVERYSSNFAGGIFWVNFTQPDLIQYEVAACSDLVDDTPLESQVNKVRSDWQSEIPRLLVFDNCEDPDLLSKWLPSTGGSRVLVTSRQDKWDPALPIELVPLGMLERPESIAMLQSFRDVTDPDDTSLDGIAAELGDLPLALYMAGNFLCTYHKDITPERYLEMVRHTALPKPGSSKKGEFSPSGCDLQVGRLLALDINWLKRESEANRLTLDLLERVAYFAPGELIPRELIRASLGTNKGNTAVFGYGVNRLLELGLVEQNGAGDLQMHALVSWFVRELLPDKEALALVEQAVLSAAARANQSGTLARMRPLLAHLKHLADGALKGGYEQATRLANELGYYLETRGDFPGARSYYMQALALNQKLRGDGHPDTTVSLNNLGGLLESIGDYEGARPYYEKALVIRRKVLGADHPDTARSLNNMGHLLLMMGNHAEARPYFEQALAIRRKAFGEEHPDTVVSLNNLGGLLQAMGDYTGARTYFRQALAINRKVLGEDDPDTATSLNNMGEVLQAMGDHAGARPYFEQALAIRRKVLGEEHPDTASSLNNLGEIFHAMGDSGEAKPYFERALAIRKKVLGDRHPATIVSLTNLGGLLQTMGDYTGARQYFEQALAVNQKEQVEKQPLTDTNLQQRSWMSRIVLVALFIFSLAIIGWQAFSRESGSSPTSTGPIPTPTVTVALTSAVLPGANLPTATIYLRRTPTPSRTPTATFTPTRTVPPVFFTSTIVGGGPIPPTRIPRLPTNTPRPPTFTARPPTSVPPTDTPRPPTNTPQPPPTVAPPDTPVPPTVSP